MWNIVGLEIQGRGHRERQIPCQDSIYSIQNDNLAIIALSDGAGSASHSHYGARAAVETMSHYVEREFDKLYSLEEVEVVQELIATELKYMLQELEDTHDQDIKTFASTLLLVAVKEERALILHLGDGEIGALQNNQSIPISSGWNGEYSNATVFTTSQHATKYMKLIKSKDASKFEGFFLMSDGSAESLYSKKNKQFSPIFQQLSSQLNYYNHERLQQQLAQDFEHTVIQRTKDDCSFIMMSRVSHKVLNSTELERLYYHLPAEKGNSFRKMELLYAQLKEGPMTLPQLVKATHQKKKVVRQVLRIFRHQNLVVYEDGKYVLRK